MKLKHLKMPPAERFRKGHNVNQHSCFEAACFNQVTHTSIKSGIWYRPHRVSICASVANFLRQKVKRRAVARLLSVTQL